MTLVTSAMGRGILDIRTTRELALQISGIGKIVYTGSRRRQGAAEPVRASAERPQPGLARSAEGCGCASEDALCQGAD
ncbi:hypothetical protein ACVWWH_003133 [Sinomonas sp. RB5]